MPWVLVKTPKLIYGWRSRRDMPPTTDTGFPATSHNPSDELDSLISLQCLDVDNLPQISNATALAKI